MATDDLRKHLELIQAVINRQAQASFLLKGWSVTLVSALLAVKVVDKAVALPIAFLPALIFWALDAFYLCQERRFRALYDAVRRGEMDDDPFTMSTAKFNQAVSSWLMTLVAPTVAWFHAVVVIVIVIAIRAMR